MPDVPQGDGATRPPILLPSPDERLGVAIVGLGGAVATTAVAGVALMQAGAAGTEGLPLAALPEALTEALVPYTALTFAGWDLSDADLAAAALHHNVLDARQFDAAREALMAVTPWPAVGNDAFCRGVTGTHCHGADLPLREVVDQLRRDIAGFREAAGRVVVINLASTEASPDLAADVFQTPGAFEAAIDASDSRIPPAMLYAYAAILEGAPYGNFTPSTGADVPALVALAERLGVPLAGKDGKTGQTFLKTLIAPGLRDRALRVDGWFSTNILGNRDGEALREAGSLASKIGTKGSVLDQILGYPVEDHVVKINYYRPRGDAKEAWDNIDVVGFLGQAMQLKLNFLCKDSILAAPLVLDIARALDGAQRTGQGGAVEAMGVFFKGPMTRGGGTPEHDFGRQQIVFTEWLSGVAEALRAAQTAAA